MEELTEKKIDFKAKTVKRDEEWHCIMITASVQQVDIIIVNTYAPQIGGYIYTKQIEKQNIKGEMNSNIMVEDFNTTLTSMDRSSRLKSDKETLPLNDTLYQIDY